MAGANHNASTYFRDCFVSPRSSLRSRRIVPHIRLADMAPPVMHLWMKLSGRWIEAAGFYPGQRLRIEVSRQRLVITPIDDADGDPGGQAGCFVVDPAATQQPTRVPVTVGEA
ncbi:SymE family type I addiction module toxin [Burkholderia cenocepacia]|uniref:SymE family type I addiction module toxin n=1 Tax=Burkholderia cenocepacia TaxID=95486 RepID=UPI0023B9B1B7|nr:SymE family type I addiction module toxin [Burkholderia cenocepacia]MDF0503836.1 SymE family type I addiction module toxin [Burkholderia cenocepacia]